MLKINPRTHSTCFDSAGSPPQFMIEAVWVGLDCMGPNDHDTFAGWDEAEVIISSTSVTLIRGMEISCAANGIGMHLLALLLDPSNGGLLTRTERTRESRTTRALKIVENLSADHPTTWEQVLAFAPEGGPTGRPHIADVLVTAGTFNDRSVAFVKVLHPSSPCYVRYWASDPIEVVQLVLEVGGVPVPVHPEARACQRLLPEPVIEDMKEVGLFDVERDHRSHAPGNREAVDRIVRRLDLRVFGSSDYHGIGKSNCIGENPTTFTVIDETVERVHLRALHP